MPKKLLAEGLCARCRAPLETVTVVSIANDGIGDLGESLEACTQLRSIYLGSNLLREVRVLEACRELWRIDLADNAINNLDGIVTFNAMGRLDLSQNALCWKQVERLHAMHIVELDLRGNKALRKAPAGCPWEKGSDLSTSKYRALVLHMLPLLWILDGEFITMRERRESAIMCGDPPPHADTSGFRGGDWDSPLELGALATQHLVVLAQQPSRERFVDTYRLQHLRSHYEREARCHNAHVRKLMQGRIPGDCGSSTTAVVRELRAVNACSTSGAGRGAAGLLKQLGWVAPMPEMWTEKLCALPHANRLDLAVVLAARAQFPSIPAHVLFEALTIAFAGEAPAAMLGDVVALPPWATTVVVHELRRSLLPRPNDSQRTVAPTGASAHHAKQQEVCGAVQGNQADATDPLTRELLEALPEVSAGPLLEGWVSVDKLNEEVKASRSTRSIEDVDEDTSLLARHAAIVLSRSPSFPQLPSTDISRSHPRERALTMAARRTRDALMPLLKTAGMTADDLVLPDSPLRHSIDDAGAVEANSEEDAMNDSSELLEGGHDRVAWSNGLHFSLGAASSALPGVPCAASPLVRADEAAPSEPAPGSPSSPTRGLIGAAGAVSGEASAPFYRTRQPAEDDMVDLVLPNGQRVVAAVAIVSTECGFVHVSAGDERFELGIRELVWVPERQGGMWRHHTALAADGKDMAAGQGAANSASGAPVRRARLFRSTAAIAADGVPYNSGVPNKPLVKMQCSGAPCVDKPAPPNVVSGFVTETSWNNNFVLAPPSLIGAQNEAMRGTCADKSHSGWSPMAARTTAVALGICGAAGHDRKITVSTGDAANTFHMGMPCALRFTQLAPKKAPAVLVSAAARASTKLEQSSASHVSTAKASAPTRLFSKRRPQHQPYDPQRAWAELQREMGSLRAAVLGPAIAQSSVGLEALSKSGQGTRVEDGMSENNSPEQQSFFLTQTNEQQEAEYIHDEQQEEQHDNALSAVKAQAQQMHNRQLQQSVTSTQTRQGASSKLPSVTSRAVRVRVARGAGWKAGQRNWFTIGGKKQWLVAPPHMMFNLADSSARIQNVASASTAQNSDRIVVMGDAGGKRKVLGRSLQPKQAQFLEGGSVTSDDAQNSDLQHLITAALRSPPPPVFAHGTGNKTSVQRSEDAKVLPALSRSPPPYVPPPRVTPNLSLQ